ncbi:class I SAM-dependent methyltransferase [Sedimentitalea todarodis]|uniref:Class I SAM-dependent methyltransferase n=1 Tax=Sedimentitalea todarodis TaxID=1631240 RepID=A0ABU3V9Y9_9RHOB|nr:class I SAM-dependent methyltransferase [Sedimentitalea todarodis]MDU9002979.1 class I SAM-dependent methyltransferase [Sedimentitalea todarodis]
MQAPDTSQEHASARLHAALGALDSAMIELDEVQKKFDSVSGRIDSLLINTAKSPTANLGANLRSLNARSEVLRKALDRARRNFASARKGYHQASRAYASKHEQHTDALAAARMELADAERCKGALSRSISSWLDPRDLGGGTQSAQTLKGHEGSFGYLPINPARFFDLLIVLERVLALDADFDDPVLRHRPVRFLDVGCGTGRNLALVRSGNVLKTEALAGFDIDAGRIAEGKAAFDLDTELSVADAMTFDYGGHDVIYSFRPFHDPDMMQQYESHLVASMQTSAYLIAVLPEDLVRFPELSCVSGSRGIWKKTG